MSNAFDSTYLDTCKKIIAVGRLSTDRTGTGTTKIAGLNMRFDLQEGFPLLTSKFVPFAMIQHELEFFLKGMTNNKWLKDRNVHIWDQFEGKFEELGPIYGAQWRDWEGPGIGHRIDQIADLMEGLKSKPMSRRHIVTGWNPAVLPIEGRSHAENVDNGLQALPPCHTMWQMHCFELTQEERMLELAKKRLLFSADYKTEEQWTGILDAHDVPKYGITGQLYQRSADMFLGVPFNIASYSLLTMMIAHSLNMKPLEFIWNGGDCHIYSDHAEQVVTQISRELVCASSPKLKIKAPAGMNLWDYTADNFELVNYNPMGKIPGKMSV